MAHQRGDYDFHEVDFEILPHALRVVFPKSKSGRSSPRVDPSNLADWVDARYLDVKVCMGCDILK